MLTEQSNSCFSDKNQGIIICSCLEWQERTSATSCWVAEHSADCNQLLLFCASSPQNVLLSDCVSESRYLKFVGDDGQKCVMSFGWDDVKHGQVTLQRCMSQLMFLFFFFFICRRHFCWQAQYTHRQSLFVWGVLGRLICRCDLNLMKTLHGWSERVPWTHFAFMLQGIARVALITAEDGNYTTILLISVVSGFIGWLPEIKLDTVCIQNCMCSSNMLLLSESCAQQKSRSVATFLCVIVECFLCVAVGCTCSATVWSLTALGWMLSLLGVVAMWRLLLPSNCRSYSPQYESP